MNIWVVILKSFNPNSKIWVLEDLILEQKSITKECKIKISLSNGL